MTRLLRRHRLVSVVSVNVLHTPILRDSRAQSTGFPYVTIIQSIIMFCYQRTRLFSIIVMLRRHARAAICCSNPDHRRGQMHTTDSVVNSKRPRCCAHTSLDKPGTGRPPSRELQAPTLRSTPPDVAPQVLPVRRRELEAPTPRRGSRRLSCHELQAPTLRSAHGRSRVNSYSVVSSKRPRCDLEEATAKNAAIYTMLPGATLTRPTPGAA